MEKDTIIISLVLFTLLAGLAVGFYQLYSVERAKLRGSTTSFADRGNSAPR